ncbi:hypothetical protein [Falsiroseomonas sp. CW058]|uniref:hypothetical protein n=1 Tax=Falsiroseomonas sp. CW058 TaxID=3388664 RepID=UPI003D31B9D6
MAIMFKGAQSRLNDVRDAIVARTAPPYRANMTTWINDYWTASHLGNDAVKKQLSDVLTMTDVANAGDEATRMKRRVLVFLEGIKAGSNLVAAKAAVGNLPAGALDARIGPLVAKLTIQANQDKGNGELVRDKFLVELKQQPEHFLRNNRLLSGAIGAGAANYFFYEYNKDQYKIDMTRPAQFLGAYHFQAAAVPGVFWLNVPGRTNNPANGSFAAIAPTVLGTGVNDAPVMISTMFSGCAFCFKQETLGAGRLLAAHIMPDDGNGGVVSGGGTGLARQLAGQVPGVVAGNFSGSAAGNFRVYGAGWSNLAAPLNVGYPVRTQNDQFMNIFGTRINNAWQIWSQHILNGQKTVVRVL